VPSLGRRNRKASTRGGPQGSKFGQRAKRVVPRSWDPVRAVMCDSITLSAHETEDARGGSSVRAGDEGPSVPIIVEPLTQPTEVPAPPVPQEPVREPEKVPA
jgi:hypothetical protein